jgi:hypothetical protein
MPAKRVMKVYELYWSPEGRKIATVEASTAKAAKRKAPQPYRKYLGEIYTKEIGTAASNPRTRTTKDVFVIQGNYGQGWEDVTEEDSRKDAARHTTCRYCQLDIEGFSPYRKCEWRDRGNNTHCNDGKHCHAPYIERRTRRNPELALPSNKFVNAKVRMKGGKIQVMADERVLGKAGFKAGAGLSGVSVSGGAKLNPKRKRKCANCGHSAASHEDGSGSLGRCYHGSSRGDQCDCRKYE